MDFNVNNEIVTGVPAAGYRDRDIPLSILA
jgi:hypothetical protein